MSEPKTTILLIALLLLSACGNPHPKAADKVTNKDNDIFDCREGFILSPNSYQQFKQEKVSLGKCQMVEDVEEEKQTAEENQHRHNLWQALQTRALTNKEMKEVLDYGDMINMEPMQPYMEDAKQKERDEAFLQQARLQAVAHGRIQP